EACARPDASRRVQLTVAAELPWLQMATPEAAPPRASMCVTRRAAPADAGRPASETMFGPAVDWMMAAPPIPPIGAVRRAQPAARSERRPSVSTWVTLRA